MKKLLRKSEAVQLLKNQFPDLSEHTIYFYLRQEGAIKVHNRLFLYPLSSIEKVKQLLAKERRKTCR